MAPAPQNSEQRRIRCPRIGVAAWVITAAVLAGGSSAIASTPSAPGLYMKTVPRRHDTTLRALFDEELAAAAQDHKPVVVVFTADWCSPCKTLKHLIEDSETVQEAARAAHFLFIDVDDWRGPAHQLIPGANPSRLPMLARVDDKGALVKLCMGSELGLLGEDSTATNLTHLIRGEALEAPAYDADPVERSRLLREEAARTRERTEGIPAVVVQVLDGRPSPPPLITQRFRLRVTMRNHDARRRWFAISAPNDELTESPVARGYERVAYTAHRRAFYTRFDSDPDVSVFPLAGWGQVEVEGWEVDALPGDTIQVWELDRLTVGGEAEAFDKKVPYELAITNPQRQRVVAWRWEDLALKLKPGQRHSFVLQAPAP